MSQTTVATPLSTLAQRVHIRLEALETLLADYDGSSNATEVALELDGATEAMAELFRHILNGGQR